MGYYLSQTDKITIIAAGAFSVIVAVIFITCLLGPGCCLNDVVGRRRKLRQRLLQGKYVDPEKPQQALERSYLTNVQLDAKSNLVNAADEKTKNYGHAVNSSAGLSGKIFGKAFHKKQRDSTYSSCSSSTCSSQDPSGPYDPNSPCNSHGKLTFWLKFSTTGSQQQTGRLHIGIEDAQDLPSNDYLNSCDPFVMMKLTKSRWAARSRSGDGKQEFRSRTVRRSRNPKFDENFSTEIPINEIKHFTLKLSVYDADRHANPTALGQVSIPLAEIPHMTTEKIILTKTLSPIKQELGEVLVGLTYLPTAQRLSFSILKATNLKYRMIVEDMEEFHPYVKVVMMKGSGRVIKKKKTTFKRSITNPVYNETLTFDLPLQMVESVVFLVMLFSKTNPSSVVLSMEPEEENGGMVTPGSSPEKNNNEKNNNIHKMNSSDSSNLEDGFNSEARSSCSLPRNKDPCLGKLVLGSNVKGIEEKQHWVSMLNTPRKVVSQWHMLK